jgi:type VII secretion protein EccE
MRNPLASVRLQFSTVHTLWTAALAPLCIALVMGTRYERWGIAAVAIAAVLTIVTFRGRRLRGWVWLMFGWIWRHRRSPAPPSEPVVGATVMPGDHVAVRWQGEVLVALIELIPRPFTPSVIVGGRAHTDDVLDTRLVEDLLSVHCPDLEADVVSAGYRVGAKAAGDVLSLYQETIGSDPAPAHRRTWIMLRADPRRAGKSAQRRDIGVAGLIRYLVASTTRVADQLASRGVDALCVRSFDDFDRATEISFSREKWSKIKGDSTFTAAYTAPGGPDVWWSVPADRTITLVRVAPGMAPRSTVLLTTTTKPKRPKGFSCVSGAQRAALQGHVLVADRHCEVPIGSAGVLVGETSRKHPVYLPLDDVDTCITLGDAQAFTQFAVRAAAAGGIVTLAPRFRKLAELIGAETGPVAKVAWPHATTYLEPHPGVDRVMLRHNLIDTPRHRQLPIRLITPADESRYQLALPG